LTGLGNRAFFFSKTERLLARFERYGDPMAILMVDLDHFKDINDTLGHQVGDRVIQTVAGRIAPLGGGGGGGGRGGGVAAGGGGGVRSPPAAGRGGNAEAAGTAAALLLAD